jgi:hypothetical protein
MNRFNKLEYAYNEICQKHGDIVDREGKILNDKEQLEALTAILKMFENITIENIPSTKEGLCGTIDSLFQKEKGYNEKNIQEIERQVNLSLPRGPLLDSASERAKFSPNRKKVAATPPSFTQNQNQNENLEKKILPNGMVQTIDIEGDTCYILPGGNLEHLEDRHYEIAKILDHRTKNRKREFLVRWKGVNNEEDFPSWIPEQASFKDLINEYMKKRNSRSKK